MKLLLQTFLLFLFSINGILCMNEECSDWIIFNSDLALTNWRTPTLPMLPDKASSVDMENIIRTLSAKGSLSDSSLDNERKSVLQEINNIKERILAQKIQAKTKRKADQADLTQKMQLGDDSCLQYLLSEMKKDVTEKLKSADSAFGPISGEGFNTLEMLNQYCASQLQKNNL
jgi:hypothetical protein